MNRRHFVSRAALSMGSAIAIPHLGFGAPSKDPGPIAETRHGKVRGINDSGVYIFKGIPYGASTAGANRFMPPKKPQPWAGVRDCLVGVLLGVVELPLGVILDFGNVRLELFVALGRRLGHRRPRLREALLEPVELLLEIHLSAPFVRFATTLPGSAISP